MRKVIGGKLYDTKTAAAVASWENHYLRNDFQWCAETLYRTSKGNWFLFGQGGAMSAYSVPVESRSSAGGQDIQAMTPDEARQWLEVHNQVEALLAHFKDQTEDA